MTIGEPCWIHLFTADVDAAVTFYGGLFGWSVGEPSEEFGGYRMFLRERRADRRADAQRHLAARASGRSSCRRPTSRRPSRRPAHGAP